MTSVSITSPSLKQKVKAAIVEMQERRGKRETRFSLLGNLVALRRTKPHDLPDASASSLRQAFIAGNEPLATLHHNPVSSEDLRRSSDDVHPLNFAHSSPNSLSPADFAYLRGSNGIFLPYFAKLSQFVPV